MNASHNPLLEKLPDYLLGLSFAGWAVVGILQDSSDLNELFPVRLSLALLQVMVGGLLMLRPVATEQGTWQALLASLPSFLASGILFRLSLPLAGWLPIAQWIFVGGVIWVMACFWSLRHSFAIFPARRAIVRGGPYRLVRHPAYLGELVMAGTCSFASGDLIAWICCGILIPLLMVRIWREEALLGHDVAYLTYKGQTRWRLLPGIW